MCLSKNLHVYGVTISAPQINSVFHAQTKHMEIDFHFMRGRVTRKMLNIKFISSKDQITDCFTKALHVKNLDVFKHNLNCYILIQIL
jgi:hypothetical protein